MMTPHIGACKRIEEYSSRESTHAGITTAIVKTTNPKRRADGSHSDESIQKKKVVLEHLERYRDFCKERGNAPRMVPMKCDACLVCPLDVALVPCGHIFHSACLVKYFHTIRLQEIENDKEKSTQENKKLKDSSLVVKKEIGLDERKDGSFCQKPSTPRCPLW